MIPLAHAEDLVVDLPLFAGPVAILAGWLVFNRVRGRRSAPRGGPSADRR
jgi:hypothetical protein